MEWESVVLKEPALSINKNYIYFNSAMRYEIGLVDGMDFFMANSEGKTILSCKPGKQFCFSKKKNEYRIICQELANYILNIYDSVNHFKLIFDNGYYILVPDIKSYKLI